jgi:hypothetical protein
MPISQLYPENRPILSQNFSKTKKISPGLSYSRASTGTYVDSAGLIKTALISEPRFDHDSLTGEIRGLLVEEARTNILINSNLRYPVSTTNISLVNFGFNPSNTVDPRGLPFAIAPSGEIASKLSFISGYTRNAGANTYTVGFFYSHGTFNGIISVFVKPAEWTGFEVRYGNQESNRIFRYFDLTGTGTCSNSDCTITLVSGGWYRITLPNNNQNRLSFIPSSSYQSSSTGDGFSGIYIWGAQLELGTSSTSHIPTPATFTGRASTATFYDAAGVIQTAASGVARSNAFFPDSSGVMRPAGLLLESAATNAILNSGNWESFATTKQNIAALTNTIISPDGTTTVKELQATATNFAVSYQTVSLVAGTRYTLSAYFRAGTHTNAQLRLFDGSFFAVATFNLTTSTSSGGLIEKLPNGWVRCSVSGTAVSTTSVGRAYFDFENPVTTSSTLYIWAAQLETGSFATSYIPTVASTVTRLADTSTSSTVTRAADTFSPITLPSSNNTTILIETETTSNNTPILSLNDGTSTNEVTLINHPFAGGSSLIDSSGSFGSVATSAGGNRLYKTTTALSVSDSEVKIVSDQAVSGSSSISSTGLNQLKIGSNVANSSFNGTIKNLYCYPNKSETEVLTALSKRNETTLLPPADKPNLTLSIAIPRSNTTWNLRSTGTVNYDVDWGDGQVEIAQTSNTKEHVYANAGIYKVVVTIRSGVWRPFFNNTADTAAISYINAIGSSFDYGTNFTSAFFGSLNLYNFLGNGFLNKPTNVSSAWRGCINLVEFPYLDLSSVTNATAAWRDCKFLTSFPEVDLSNCTTLGIFTFNITFSAGAWQNCINLKSFPGINLSKATICDWTWQNCTSMTTFGNVIFNTLSPCSYIYAWDNCTSLIIFPDVDISTGNNFRNAWNNCTSMTTFLPKNLSNGGDFFNAWRNCTSLQSFVDVNISSATNLYAAWYNCTSMTTFNVTDMSNCTTFADVNNNEGFPFGAWYNCTSLQSFPDANMSSGTTFQAAWRNCTSMTTFGNVIFNNNQSIDFFNAWRNCSSLIIFPDVNLSKGTSFNSTWLDCTSMTTFLPKNLSSGINFFRAWRNCTSLQSFVDVNISSATNLEQAWYNCTSMTTFNVTDMSNCTTFGQTNSNSGFPFGAWTYCTSLQSFPDANMSSGTAYQQVWRFCTSMTTFGNVIFNNTIPTSFYFCWGNCTSLANFPPNVFNNSLSIDFNGAFSNCALTAQSIENILVSINTANTSNGTLGLAAGTNATKTTWTTAANTAYDALIARGWTIAFNA